MVLEHQTQAHNLITRAGYQTRLALHDQQVIDEMMGEKSARLSPTAERRIWNAVEPLVNYLLFVEECRLTQPLRGTSTFVEEFAARGPRDRRGRSLRDFDLQTRMFKLPLSYTIYSRAFDGLPKAALSFIYRRLWEVLTGKDASPDFNHLSSADRRAILEVLIETKPGLPDYWHGRGEAPGAPAAGNKGAPGASTAEF
jgi:hypothetical protein